MALDPLPDGFFPVGWNVYGAVLAVETEAQTEGAVSGVGLLTPARLLAALALHLDEIAAKHARLLQEFAQTGVEPPLLLGQDDARRHQNTS
jgi:hypothetical protein